MNTLQITVPTRKEDIIKQANKFRLANKNKWYQLEIHYSPNVYKIKAYNTWLQIIRTERDGQVISNSSGVMDITATQFKQSLDSIII